MPSKTNFIHMALLILLAIIGQALSGRNVPNVNVKQAEFLHKSDRSFLIPGVGRVLVPPHFSKIPPKKLPHLTVPSYGPPSGTTVPSYGPPSGTGRYVPGADDTFFPNPGFETPNPGRGHYVRETARP